MKRKFWLAIFLALLANFGRATNARAHANLLRSTPADGAIIEKGPGEVRLWFDEAISAKFSTAQLFDADSKPVPITAIRVDTADPTLMILILPKLPDGPYSILYKALSDSDGHFSQGLMVFGVGTEADLGATILSQAVESELPVPEAVLRWLNFTLLAGIIGAIAIAQLVLTPAWHNTAVENPAKKVFLEAQSRIIHLAAICAWLAIVVGFGFLVWQSTSLLRTFPQGASFRAVTWQILTDTRWGMTWFGHQVILLLIALFLLALIPQIRNLPGLQRHWSDKFVWTTLSFLALALVATQALSSHASGLAENTSLALVADALHFLAASLWVGGLLSLAIALLPLLRQQKDDITTLIRAGWRPFSLVAVFSVGILVATGLYSAGRQVASPDALLTTYYGKALMGKVSLMLAVGFVGLLNSILLHPHLAKPLALAFKRPAGWTPLSLKHLPTLVLVEGTLGLLVLLTTSLITASPTPRGSEFIIIPEEVPNALTQTVDDMVITFGAKPNRPGQNVFTVFAASTRKPPPTEIARVILRFHYQEQEVGRESVIAEEIEPGRYMIGGNYLNLAGLWQVDVVVRRLGVEDSVAHFDWIVAPPGKTQPVIFSRVPLEPILTFTAALLLLAIFGVGTFMWLVRNKPFGLFQRRNPSGHEMIDPGGNLIDGAITNVEGSGSEGEVQPLVTRLKGIQSEKYEIPFSWTMEGD